MLQALSAYGKDPKVRFKDQEQEEAVLLLLRRHPITNLWWILVTLALLLSPFLVFPANIFPDGFNIRLLPWAYSLLTILAWYLFVFGFVLINFLDWFFNVYLITSQRLVDMDYINFLYFRVSETKYGNIEDVTYHVSGLPQIVFNYGDVLLQTAGTVPNFELERVPNPAGVHDLITDLMGRSNGK